MSDSPETHRGGRSSERNKNHRCGKNKYINDSHNHKTKREILTHTWPQERTSTLPPNSRTRAKSGDKVTTRNSSF